MEVWFWQHGNIVARSRQCQYSFDIKESWVLTSTKRICFVQKQTVIVCLSWPSSGPESWVAWLWKIPASGWESLWESSSVDPWIVPYAFQDVFGAVPEWPWISGFRRKSLRRDSAAKMRFPSYWAPETTSLSLYPQFHRKLEWCSILVIWQYLRFVPS